MALFIYKAKTEDGRFTKGMVEAVNKDIAADILTERGLFVIDIFKKSRIHYWEEVWNAIFNNIKTKDLVLFMHQLAVLISAEIPIVQALRILEKQIENKYMKKVVLEIADDVEGGGKLSEAFGRHPKVFNNFFIKMIKSGETSGKLEEVFLFLADEQEKNYLLTRKIRNALIYPAFIIFILLVVGIIMLVFVVPRITLMFESANVELPLSTKILIKTSHIVSSYWWFLLVMVGFCVYVFKLYVNTPSGRKNVDNFVLKIPVVGGLLKKFYLTRFSRSFYTLILGGVDIINSLKASEEVVSNTIFKDLLKKAVKEVADGNSVASVFSKSDLIPPMYSQMLYVGENTGKLTSVLEKITAFYTDEIEDMVKNSLALFEPAVMVLIGIAVGFLVFSVIMPMYELSSAF